MSVHYEERRLRVKTKVRTVRPMKDERFEMRVSEDFLRQIDDWRRQQPDLPSRAEAIRRLIEAGLAAQKGRKKSS